jgi:hypothetical protein
MVLLSLIPIEFSLQCAVFDNRNNDDNSTGEPDNSLFVKNALGAYVASAMAQIARWFENHKFMCVYN